MNLRPDIQVRDPIIGPANPLAQPDDIVVGSSAYLDRFNEIRQATGKIAYWQPDDGQPKLVLAPEGETAKLPMTVADYRKLYGATAQRASAVESIVDPTANIGALLNEVRRRIGEV